MYTYTYTNYEINSNHLICFEKQIFLSFCVASLQSLVITFIKQFRASLAFPLLSCQNHSNSQIINVFWVVRFYFYCILFHLWKCMFVEESKLRIELSSIILFWLFFLFHTNPSSLFQIRQGIQLTSNRSSLALQFIIILRKIDFVNVGGWCVDGG